MRPLNDAKQVSDRLARAEAQLITREMQLQKGRADWEARQADYVAQLEELDAERHAAEMRAYQLEQAADVYVSSTGGHHWRCEFRTAAKGWKQGDPPIIECQCGLDELVALLPDPQQPSTSGRPWSLPSPRVGC